MREPRSGLPAPALSRRTWLTVLILGSLALACSATGAASGSSEAPPALRGVTLDSLGRALSGVQVVLAPAQAGATASETRTVRSDTDGRFVVGELVPGTYRIVALKGGYSVVVGQIDTLLKNTIELVLRPAGEGPAGTRPLDRGWALRQPARDGLEEITPAIAGAERPAEADELTGPLLVELSSSQSDQAGGELAGMTALLAGEVPIDELGRISLSFRHEDHRNRGRFEEGTDALAVSWVPDPGLSSGVPAVRVDALRDFREAGPRGDELLAYSTEGVRVQATWAVLGHGRALEAHVDAAGMQGSQHLESAVPSRIRGHRLALSLAEHRAWGRAHESRFGVTVRSAGGAFEESAGGTWLLNPLASVDGPAGLDLLDGTSVTLDLEDRWIAREDLAIEGVWRIEHGPEVNDTRLRSAAGVGVRWTTPLGFDVEAAGGLMGASGAPESAWRAAFGRRHDRLSWMFARAREPGFSPWGEDALLEEAELRMPLLTGRDGALDRWGMHIGWRPWDAGPRFELRGEQLEVEGRLAAGLPGDSPVVPIAEEGRATGRRVEFIVASAGSGTRVGFSLLEVNDDAGQGALLAGARVWRQQQLQLRQRLGSLGWYGADWQLLFHFERGEVGGAPETAEEPSSRLAQLERRRVSGGLAVVF